MTIIHAYESPSPAPTDSPIDGTVVTYEDASNTDLSHWEFIAGGERSVAVPVLVPDDTISVTIKLYISRPDPDSTESVQFFLAGRGGVSTYSGLQTGANVLATTIPEDTTVPYALGSYALTDLAFVADQICQLDLGRDSVGSIVTIGVHAIDFTWS